MPEKQHPLEVGACILLAVSLGLTIIGGGVVCVRDYPLISGIVIVTVAVIVVIVCVSISTAEEHTKEKERQEREAEEAATKARRENYRREKYPTMEEKLEDLKEMRRRNRALIDVSEVSEDKKDELRRLDDTWYEEQVKNILE